MYLSIPKWTQIEDPGNSNSILNSLVNYEKITRHAFFSESRQEYLYFCSSCKQHISVEWLINTESYFYKNGKFW